MFTPREYQLQAHDKILECFKRAAKTLLVMSTGAGKTKTLASFMAKYLKHFNWVVVVRKKDLVNQLADTFNEFEFDFGVFMANDPRYAPKKSIQLCSIDTLDARGVYPFLYESKDIILVIDEADESLAPGYQTVIEKYTKRHLLPRPSHTSSEEMLKPIRPAFLLGMTATPYDYPLSHFDEYVEPVTAAELRDNYKALVDFRYYIPKLIDLSTVRVEKGEFNAKDIERVVNSPEAIKEDFEAWLTYGEDRQTLIFTTNQTHNNNVASYINFYYGKTVAVAVDANTPPEDRKHIYALFAEKEIRFLVSVHLIKRGVDIPEIGCILDLAPTMSINNHIQKIGRGSRPNPYYQDCIVIDRANNLVNNGPFYPKYLPRVINLKERRRRTKRDLEAAQMRICTNCFRAAEPGDFGPKNTCPYCGHGNGKVKGKKLSKAAQKRLETEGASPEKLEQLKMIGEFKKYLFQFQKLGKKGKQDARTAAHLKMFKTFGIANVERIKGAIGLPDHLIRSEKEKAAYVPLGGMK